MPLTKNIKTTTLYNGNVKISFNEDKHIYSERGQTIDGVTTILHILNKPNLIPWAVKLCADNYKEKIKAGQSYDEIFLEALYKESKAKHKEKSEDAATHGTMLHAWLEAHAKAEAPETPTNEVLKKSAEQLQGWIKEHNVRIKFAERIVYSRNNLFCGTADMFGMYEGIPFVGDLKTSSGVFDEMLLQLAAYNGAFKEEFGRGLDRGIIIRCGKDGAFETKVWSRQDLEDAYHAFLGLNTAHKFMKTMKYR